MKLNKIAALVIAPVVASSALAGHTHMNTDAVNAQVSHMDAVLDQNHDKAFNTSAIPRDWSNRVKVSGEVNVDGYFSNRTSVTANRFQDGNSSSIDLANANLYVDAVVSCWVKAHVAMAYQGARWATSRLSNDHPIYTTGNNGRSGLSEAYVQVANLSQSPFYGQFGRQAVDFGAYDTLNPVTMSMYQQLTETIGDAAELGFASANGFHGSVFVMRPKTATSTTTDTSTGTSLVRRRQRANNWGLNVGYTTMFNHVGFNIGASYMRDFADVNFINARLLTTATTGSVNDKSGYEVHVGFNYNPFDFAVAYVTASSKFAAADVAFKNATNRAEPSAYDVDLGYHFLTAGHHSRLGLSYQHSSDSAFFGAAADGLPESRWDLGYSVALVKNAGIEAHWLRDKDYKRGTANYGTNKSSSTFVVRIGARFA